MGQRKLLYMQKTRFLGPIKTNVPPQLSSRAIATPRTIISTKNGLNAMFIFIKANPNIVPCCGDFSIKKR